MKLITPKIPEYKELEKGIKEILKTKQLTTGKYTKLVEEEIKKIHGCKYSLLVSSGTTAFMLLLSAVNKFYKHKETICQDFTWESVKHLVLLMAASPPSFCDINKDTWLAEEPTNKEALFIPNMTFGNCITYKHKKTIYDSSHCLGNPICNGRGYGEIISFSPAKMISACEGGCIITNNKKIYDECLWLRQYHGRISELNALFLYHNLKNLDKEIERKVEIDIKYMEGFGNESFYSWTYDKENWCNIPNEFVYTNPKMNDKIRKKLSEVFDIRLRYKPTEKDNKNSWYIYNHQIVLPQVGGEKQKEVIKKLNEICK